MKRNLLVAVLFGVFLAAFPLQSAYALDEIDRCAAVYPCNPDGTVQAPFDKGECAELYQRQCSSKKANELGDSLISCENNRDSLLVTIDSLRDEVRRLRRKRRSPRRSRRK